MPKINFAFSIFSLYGMYREQQAPIFWQWNNILSNLRGHAAASRSLWKTNVKQQTCRVGLVGGLVQQSAPSTVT